MEKPIAVITGASSGIGRAFAEEYARRGYYLVLTGRRSGVLDTLSAELRERWKVSVETAIFDLSDPEELELFANNIASRRIAVLVNNAGFGSPRAFSVDTFENQVRMIKVHVDAVVRLCHAVLPGMREEGGGAIINVSSLASFFPAPLDALYSGTKAFLTRFSEALQLEQSGTGIRVQALCPGFIRTEFHERLGLGKDFNRKSSGIFRWMEPERLVRDSLKALDRRRPPVIVVPGVFYKVVYLVHKIIPRQLIYRTMDGRMMNRVEDQE
jgi:uncharacterized protein